MSRTKFIGDSVSIVKKLDFKIIITVMHDGARGHTHTVMHDGARGHTDTVMHDGAWGHTDTVMHDGAY